MGASVWNHSQNGLTPGCYRVDASLSVYAQFPNNIHATAGTEPVRAGLDHRACIACGPNSARRLYADLHGTPHQGHILYGGNSTEKARASLHEISSGLFADCACGELFFIG